MSEISVVTVARDRTEHLLCSAELVAQSSIHREHLILDFGSTPEIDRHLLPADPRIRLIRCNWPGEWRLTHAYNLAFALSDGDWILKLDADALIPPGFLAQLASMQTPGRAQFLCDRLTVQDWKLPSSLFRTNGLFFVSRAALRAVRGFNPYVQGWGWDELDLYSRLFLKGFSAARLPQSSVNSLEHSDEQRQPGALSGISATRLKHATNQKNMLVAQQAYLQGLEWPDLGDYAAAFARDGQPPVIRSVPLLSEADLQKLARRCATTLYQPGPSRRLLWRLKALAGKGPWAAANARCFLEAAGINLELVTDQK